MLLVKNVGHLKNKNPVNYYKFLLVPSQTYNPEKRPV